MWSDTWETHLELLSYVFDRLQAAGAKISLDTGQWCKQAVNYHFQALLSCMTVQPHCSPSLTPNNLNRPLGLAPAFAEADCFALLYTGCRHWIGMEKL
ncbi:hypothetical protein AAFF_G00289840 [Aldrovandia affinis]|uniref:Uncharacterized protein n=1 Tax=Aldrovandia affinis TaxID=143900 RepID=A0AAD7W233_9TELE|nr:hypothetical protein AAFF_G00289840 [Aldrovandia affinis]